MKLFHVSTWQKLSNAKAGDEFTLRPGPQGAEGKGVYFSEGEKRSQAADSVQVGNPIAAVIVIEVAEEGVNNDWFRTKLSIIKKFGRPRSWHSKNKKVKVYVRRREGNYLFCDWRWE